MINTMTIFKVHNKVFEMYFSTLELAQKFIASVGLTTAASYPQITPIEVIRGRDDSKVE